MTDKVKTTKSAKPVKQTKAKTEVADEVHPKAAGVKVLVSTLAPIKGQDVVLTLELTEITNVTKYQWKKAGADIAAKDAGTSKSLLIKGCLDSGTAYTCEVAYGDADATVTSTACTITAIDQPANTVKDFDVKFNEFNQRGFTTMHWGTIDSINMVIDKTETSGSLLAQVKTAIETGYTVEGVTTKYPELMTFYIALAKCGVLEVKDTRDGYTTIFKTSTFKDVKAETSGRMTNLWKA